MSLLLLLTSLGFFVVFCAAGIAKLRDVKTFKIAAGAFGVPAPFVALAAILIPVSELSTAALLLVSLLWGGVAALVLLAAFSALIGMNLAMDRRPVCRCFGQISSEPIGFNTLGRNISLGIGATLLIWQGWPGQSGDHDFLLIRTLSAFDARTVATAGLVLIVCAQGWVTYHLLRQHGRTLLRLDKLEEQQQKGSGSATLIDNGFSEMKRGLPVGSVAPDFQLPDSNGGVRSMSQIRGIGQAAMLVFVEPDCGPCEALIPALVKWEQELTAVFPILVISRAVLGDRSAETVGGKPRLYLLQTNHEIADMYLASLTPSALLVDTEGRISSDLAQGANAINGLIWPVLQRQRQASLDTQSLNSLKIGDAALGLSLMTLSGEIVTLSQIVNDRVTLLLWNPGCGFCVRMLPDLHRWDQAEQSAKVKFILISSGDLDKTRAIQISSPVLLDAGFRVSRLLGATGTPAAVLLDSEGNIASAVAVGSVNIHALVGLS